MDRKEEIKKFVSELHDGIMKAYCIGFEFHRKEPEKNKEIVPWPFFSQSVLRNFVLSRPGWEKSLQADDTVLIFQGKYPLSISILYDDSPGSLLVNTAVGIAKIELMDSVVKDSSQIEGFVDMIVKLVEGEDWVIPFIRKKILSI